MQQNFSNIEDEYENISKIKEEECAYCSKMHVVNVSSLAKGKENANSTTTLNNDSPSTTKACDSKKEYVIVEDITNNESNRDEESCEKEILRVVEAQVYDDFE